MAAVPIPDPEKERAKPRAVVKGDIPSPLNPPSGCVFRTRCSKATEVCAQAVPPLEAAGTDHEVACHHWRA
jgi:oligopeptide transport system ATP-binding protein